MNAIIEEINNMIKSFRGEIDIPQHCHFNSFSLTEALKTRTITYDYYTYDEKIKHLEPTVRHTEQIKISDKLYNLLDSLTLFTTDEDAIPSDSNNNDSNNADYSLIINDCPYNDNTYILLTVHPATAQYEIVNKINIVNKTSKSNKKKQCNQTENTDIVVIPASEHRSLINQSHISMTNKYMITSLIGY